MRMKDDNCLDKYITERRITTTTTTTEIAIASKQSIVERNVCRTV